MGLAFAMLVLCLGITIHSCGLAGNLSVLFHWNVEAAARMESSWSNKLPGAQGERHPQAVQCIHVGMWDVWEIKPGCCYGAEDCSTNGCGRSFSCDGTHYL